MWQMRLNAWREERGAQKACTSTGGHCIYVLGAVSMHCAVWWAEESWEDRYQRMRDALPREPEWEKWQIILKGITRGTAQLYWSISITHAHSGHIIKGVITKLHIHLQITNRGPCVHMRHVPYPRANQHVQHRRTVKKHVSTMLHRFHKAES